MASIQDRLLSSERENRFGHAVEGQIVQEKPLVGDSYFFPHHSGVVSPASTKPLPDLEERWTLWASHHQVEDGISADRGSFLDPDMELLATHFCRQRCVALVYPYLFSVFSLAVKILFAEEGTSLPPLLCQSFTYMYTLAEQLVVGV